MRGDRARDPWATWPEGFTSGRVERDAAIVLSALAGLKPKVLLPAAAELGTASACLARVREGVLGSEGDRRWVARVDAGQVRERLQALGARTIAWDDPAYPPQLRQIHDPPFLLYVRGGDLPAVDLAVAMVGARRCSPLGRELARSIGRGLAQAGVTVVSGAARGIDAASHEGALQAGGSTVAVLGCGIDGSYPAGSRPLVRTILERGAVVSEYPPGVPPGKFRFPARNRIVAGLCRATVVVEGADGSGSRITGEHALEFGRDVFAVPGSLTSPLSYVPLLLVREGATLIRDASDLLEDLGLDAKPVGLPADLTLADLATLRALEGPTLPDRVARELRVGLADALALLMRLEMRGLVRNVGGRFEATLAAAATRS